MKQHRIADFWGERWQCYTSVIRWKRERLPFFRQRNDGKFGEGRWFVASRGFVVKVWQLFMKMWALPDDSWNVGGARSLGSFELSQAFLEFLQKERTGVDGNNCNNFVIEEWIVRTGVLLRITLQIAKMFKPAVQTLLYGVTFDTDSWRSLLVGDLSQDLPRCCMLIFLV